MSWYNSHKASRSDTHEQSEIIHSFIITQYTYTHAPYTLTT